jgi:glutamine synthetase type III
MLGPLREERKLQSRELFDLVNIRMPLVKSVLERERRHQQILLQSVLHQEEEQLHQQHVRRVAVAQERYFLVRQRIVKQRERLRFAGAALLREQLRGTVGIDVGDFTIYMNIKEVS